MEPSRSARTARRAWDRKATGCAQVLARGGPDREHLARVLERDLGVECLPLTIESDEPRLSRVRYDADECGRSRRTASSAGSATRFATTVSETPSASS